MSMNRMKVDLFLRYLAIALIPIFVLIVMGAISIVINQRYQARELRQANERTLGQIRNSMDFTFQELDSLDLIFSTSSEFLLSLNRVLASESLDFEQSKVLAAIQNFLNVSAYARPYVESIYVYIQNPNKRLLTTTAGIVELDGFNDRDWFESFLSRPPRDAFWTETRILRRLPAVEEGRPIITMFRRLSPFVGVQPPGVVVLNIYRDHLAAFLDQLKSSPEQMLVIEDSSGKVVFSDFAATAETWTARADGRRYITARLASAKYGWTYSSYTPADQLYGLSRSLRDINIAVVTLSAVLAALVTFIVSRRSFRHIEGVLDAVEAAETGRPLPTVAPGADRGFGQITYSILRTFLERKYLQVQLSERRYRQKTLELLALQSQINPHFLFNTLESINWKVIELTREPSQINDMIHGLSSILKYVLQSPFTFETLDNEIEHARSYLRIQRIRYKDRFTVRWDCEPGIGEHRVIRFLLQPLLENAIYHGIKEKEGRGLITVSARRMADRLLLVVSDNGPGMSPERLREIQARLEDEEGDGELALGSIGLSNTCKRIRLVFGPQYGIRIDSEPGTGTRVSIELPAEA